jgi:hypothetical protein
MDQARFSVFQFLENGSAEYVKKDVNLDVAVNAFANCVGAAGTTRRVIIMVGDCVHIEWTFRGGVSVARKAAI